MKKYYFEAQKKQLEKPTEPLYVSCGKAKCIVVADSDEEAAVLAEKKLQEEYYGTGIALGKPVMTLTAEFPVDWSYGYGDARKSGDTGSLGDLVGNNVIR